MHTQVIFLWTLFWGCCSCFIKTAETGSQGGREGNHKRTEEVNVFSFHLSRVICLFEVFLWGPTFFLSWSRWFLSGRKQILIPAFFCTTVCSMKRTCLICCAELQHVVLFTVLVLVFYQKDGFFSCSNMNNVVQVGYYSRGYFTNWCDNSRAHFVWRCQHTLHLCTFKRGASLPHRIFRLHCLCIGAGSCVFCCVCILKTIVSQMFFRPESVVPTSVTWLPTPSF